MFSAAPDTTVTRTGCGANAWPRSSVLQPPVPDHGGSSVPGRQSAAEPAPKQKQREPRSGGARIVESKPIECESSSDKGSLALVACLLWASWCGPLEGNGWSARRRGALPVISSDPVEYSSVTGPCSCVGSHMTWTCFECGAVV